MQWNRNFESEKTLKIETFGHIEKNTKKWSDEWNHNDRNLIFTPISNHLSFGVTWDTISRKRNSFNTIFEQQQGRNLSRRSDFLPKLTFHFCFPGIFQKPRKCKQNNSCLLTVNWNGIVIGSAASKQSIILNSMKIDKCNLLEERQLKFNTP